MQIISAREFRSNQTAVLKQVLEGESVVLRSRLGAFKIMPVTEEDTLTNRICEGLREVKMIETGKMKGFTVKELLDEL